MKLGLPQFPIENTHIGNIIYLIVPWYTVEYQNFGSEILRGDVLVENTYDILLNIIQ